MILEMQDLAATYFGRLKKLSTQEQSYERELQRQRCKNLQRNE
jgi:hypothetical protein